jgi:hypothetical protein
LENHPKQAEPQAASILTRLEDLLTKANQALESRQR